MADDSTQDGDVKSLETRFGLVMYGGVSLAIYINGVAREFFRAVHGSGVYKLVKALTDSDVVVDVISGTSAGGINGIMLAYALCNKKDFSSCATLWRLDGDVRSLLRSPYRDADRSESLFDSEGYYQTRLEAAFRDMPEYVPEEAEVGSDFPELDLFVTGTDVDGNISTQFDDAGHPIDVKDHRSVFLLKHREGRKEPFDPESKVDGPSTPEVTFQALAKLARITSCFPAAFTPVHVGATDPPGNETVDGKLQLWGSLGKDSCFLDGGVIDNKPFTYTIREIFNRAADREVERKLFYVEPDPEHFDKPDLASRPNFVQAVIASLIGIPGYESIADDLKLLATHNSKVAQYRRLRRHLEEKARQPGPAAPSPQDRELYEQCSLYTLGERVIEGILKVDGKAELLNREDREAASALIDSFDAVQKQMQAVKTDSPTRGRVPSILENFDVYYRQRRLYRTVYKLVEVLRQRRPASASAADVKMYEAEVNKYTNLWRLLNREMELLDIIRVNMERLVDDAPITWKEEVRVPLKKGDMEKVEEEAALLWAVVSEALRELIAADYETPNEVAALIQRAFAGVYAEIQRYERDPSVKLNGLSQEALGEINDKLRERAQKVSQRVGDIKQRLKALSRTPGSLDKELGDKSLEFNGFFNLTRDFENTVINALLKGAGDPHEQEVKSAYAEFYSFDAQMFPLEYIADLHEKDIIETIRISPRDARRGFSNKGLSDKVSGDALYHFGGFFKRSWRSNDILWGRLDSLCQLTETLLAPARIERALQNPLLLERVRARFFTNRPGEAEQPDWVPAMHPERLFPHAGEATQRDLAAWLEGLLWEGRPLDREDFDKTKLARIVEAAQLEVLYEDLPGVITDALEEQARWNQFRYPPGLLKAARDGGPGRGEGAEKAASLDPNLYEPVYVPSDGSLDPYISVLAATGAAHEKMRRYEELDKGKKPKTPMKTGVGQFFTNYYTIGSEALLRDLPPLVLLEILSVSLLVMRNCLLKIFGSQAARIKSQPLYVFGIDFPLRAFNTLVLFLRRVPSSRKWLPLALFFLSALLLAIGVVWRNPIVWTNGSLNLHWFVVFIAAPLAVLTAQGVYLYLGKVTEWTILRGVRDVALALVLLFPVFVMVLAYEQLYAAATAGLMKLFHGWALSLGARQVGLLGAGWGAFLARYSVLGAIGLTFLGPLLALALIARIGQRGRAGARQLREWLKKYFTIPEMLTIARRLDLFDEAELERLATEVGVFDQIDLREISRRFDLRLEEFRRSQPESNGNGSGGRQLAEGRKQIRYAVLVERYGEAERARKQRAYEGLARELDSIERERQKALAAKPRRADGDEAANGDGEAKKVAAIDRLLDEARKFEARKRSLALASIENAQHTDEAVRAGKKLAERIVAKAAEHDRRDKTKKESEKKLTRLEDLMYSINPEAMS
jgi:patatin-related protein